MQAYSIVSMEAPTEAHSNIMTEVLSLHPFQAHLMRPSQAHSINPSQAHSMNLSLAHSISHTEVYTMSHMEAHSMLPTHKEIITLQVIGKFPPSL